MPDVAVEVKKSILSTNHPPTGQRGAAQQTFITKLKIDQLLIYAFWFYGNSKQSRVRVDDRP